MIVFSDRASKSFQSRENQHAKKLIIIIGSSVLVAGLAITGESLAKSDENEVHSGTIRIEKQAEADFPGLAKLTFD